jgi:hypothetical protein
MAKLFTENEFAASRYIPIFRWKKDHVEFNNMKKDMLNAFLLEIFLMKV